MDVDRDVNPIPIPSTHTDNTNQPISGPSTQDHNPTLNPPCPKS